MWNNTGFITSYVYNCVIILLHCAVSYTRLSYLTFTKACPILFKWQWHCRVSHKALMFVSRELFPLPLSKEGGQNLDAAQIDCLPRIPVFIAACLSALLFRPYFCRPVYLTDWLSWHFLTVSFNHFTITVYHYGTRQAGVFAWYNSLLWWHKVQFT